MLGDQALEKLLRDYEFETVLDIGSGRGEQAAAMRDAGKRVTTMDSMSAVGADIYGHWPSDGIVIATGYYDCVWCSHVLEHSGEPCDFLAEIWAVLVDGGILAITVPPFKQVIAGHITAWNAGLLLYNLVLAGFDCSRAAVKTYGYNISAIVRKGKYQDRGTESTLTELAHFFPVPLTGERPKIGVLPTDIEEVNW
jgi:ubiquinone/menaquinone biosynthesis C-methylase UbiE